MDKKKAVICSILFAIVVMAVFVGAYFIKNLGFHISAIITGVWISECVMKFYDWLVK